MINKELELPVVDDVSYKQCVGLARLIRLDSSDRKLEDGNWKETKFRYEKLVPTELRY